MAEIIDINDLRLRKGLSPIENGTTGNERVQCQSCLITYRVEIAAWDALLGMECRNCGEESSLVMIDDEHESTGR